MYRKGENKMDILLFEYLPPLTLLLVVGAIVYYGSKLLCLIAEEAKEARTIAEIVLCIIAMLILCILLILMVALAIEAIV